MVIMTIIGILLLLLVIAAALFIRRSRMFVVQTIAVSGVPDVVGVQLEHDFEDFSRAHSLRFRILGADNMLAWDTDTRAFLATQLQLQALSIQKNYTQRSITIIVEGREKFGIWCAYTEQGDQISNIQPNVLATTTASFEAPVTSPLCYWFDHAGLLFAPAPHVESELFNRVYDSTGRTLGIGDHILSDRLFVNLSAIFSLLDRAQINTKTIYLRDLGLEEVEVDSVSDPRLYFSLQFSPDFTMPVIRSLRQSNVWGRATYVDFRVENRAYYR